MLLCSGREEENPPHTQGVALMVSKQAQRELTGWEFHLFRIIKPLFKTKNQEITINVIQCYAPNNHNSDNDKDQSYERLQSIMAKCSGKDMKILTGDLKAKVGMDNTEYEDIIGQHEMTERKEQEW
ncbi:unnamed protein product [Schistosoma mattheei]|uniref:Uncharacterized protein n=1 Tax=Schistosoma mattheei TaxID=31246 RepID=A0A183NDD6_9TREM|nr:unnamed protein product [Schistosoma mattheei]